MAKTKDGSFDGLIERIENVFEINPRIVRVESKGMKEYSIYRNSFPFDVYNLAKGVPIEKVLEATRPKVPQGYLCSSTSEGKGGTKYFTMIAPPLAGRR